MKKKLLTHLIIISFTWLGFVLAISFMEAWLKFQAPGITTSLGLGIGKLVFGALNKVEIVFALIISLSTVYLNVNNCKIYKGNYVRIVLLILTLQTFWLLPSLNERADLIINNQETLKNNNHIIFIALEVIKVISLYIYGKKLINIKFNKNGNQNSYFSE